ncbi:MAG: hypothetical protein ACKOE2_16325, partial [Actinomycetales bacterium]
GREYSFSQPEAAVEIYQLGVRAIGVTPKPSLASTEPVPADPPAPKEVRMVFFEGADGSGAQVQTPVYDRSELRPGTHAHGPAVIDQIDSTTLVPPNTRWEIDRNWNILIHILEVSA